MRVLNVAAAAAMLAVAGTANATIVIGSNTAGTPAYSGPTPTYDFDGGAGDPTTNGGDIVSGSTSDHAQPYGSTGGYYSVGPADTTPGDIDLSSWSDIYSISFLWGSIDDYNVLQFLDSGGGVLETFYGTDIWNPADGGQSDPDTNRLVTFLLSGADVAAFDTLRLVSDTNAFEIDDIAINAVPEPATWALMLFGFGAVGFAMRRRRAPALAQLA